jgi:hypothetical protein
MLANLRNQWGVGGGALCALFESARQRRINSLGGLQASIEINPLLCPLTDVVGQLVAPLRVVHLVRHPVSWADSIIRFGASGWRKHVIDIVPFAKPYPPKRPADWHRLDDFEKALWRWRYCNEQILKLKDPAAAFTTVRYENLFAADTAVRSNALSALLGGLGLESAGPYDWFDIDIRANSSGTGSQEGSAVAREKIEAICGALMRKFGYDDVSVQI